MSWIISHAISAVKSETPQSGMALFGVPVMAEIDWPPGLRDDSTASLRDATGIAV